MTEATHAPFRPVGALSSSGMPAINDAALRQTPGPDELRLPECEDKPIPKSTHQFLAMKDSFTQLQMHWLERPDVFVGANQFAYWDPAYDAQTNPENLPAVPDVYVVFGVANRHRGSYVVWEEGKPPDFVLEVAAPLSLLQQVESPWSRLRAARETRRVYAAMGVPEFFLYDPPKEDDLKPELSGFALREGEYKPLPEERLPRGAVGVRSKVLGLCPCIMPPSPDPMDNPLRWYDPETGEFLPTTIELECRMRRAKADAARAEAEARAAASEARVAELEALIEKMQRG